MAASQVILEAAEAGGSEIHRSLVDAHKEDKGEEREVEDLLEAGISWVWFRDPDAVIARVAAVVYYIFNEVDE